MLSEPLTEVARIPKVTHSATLHGAARVNPTQKSSYRKGDIMSIWRNADRTYRDLADDAPGDIERPRRRLWFGSMARRLAVVGSVAAIAGGIFATQASAGSSQVHQTTFSLFPNQAFLSCLAPAGQTPTAQATVTRGRLHDSLTLTLAHFKPNLGFDLFTVQRSNQTATGQPVTGFTNFGMAWYQTDVETNSQGNGSVTIKTVLLDQIFGFDPDVSLAPTNTFHVGFWFNSVAEAQPCSSTTLTATPFNGEHNAGPVAFITRPDATTNLGPLCTQPEGNPATCNP
jgi:hypothetical protein